MLQYKIHINDKDMNEIERLFSSKSIERGGLFLYKKSDAIQFVEECQKRKIIILGIDSFKLLQNNIQPLLEESIDISLETFDNKSYAKLSNFLKARPNDLFFEIICE